MSSSQPEYLFFETIAHDGEIEQVLQVDEVKFEQPVYVDEIRVLPAGYNVTGVERSPVRTGATKPMPCELEFFGKNLNARSNRDRVRYRRLGKKTFRDENDIVYFPSLSIPTDSLIIKGKYETLTIAIIGVLARPKSPSPRHDPPSNNRQIVNFLQTALPPQRPHPMDTLPLSMGPTSNTPPNSFPVPHHSHPSSNMDTATSSSTAHADGAWVAPPEQPTRQQTPAANNFPHAPPQRPQAPPSGNFVGQTPSRVNDEHIHDYNQTMYPAPRVDERAQPGGPQQYPARPQTRTNYSPSDFSHGEKAMDEMEEKGPRMPTNIPQYRPNISVHMADDSNVLMLNPNVPMMNPGFSYLSQQTPYLNDPQRRLPETPTAVATIHPQEHRTDGDSYFSDDNTSESEISSVHGIFFNEDDEQAVKRDALYNTRGSTRFTTLKTFHSPTKTPYEIECEKAQHDSYRPANEDILVQFRKLLSHVSIDHCSQSFLESLESLCTVLPTALACLDSNEERSSAIQRLMNWASSLIDIDCIISKQFTDLENTLLKVRIIKCGIRLSGHLSVLTEEMSNDWIKSDFQSKLLDLYDNKYISPSVKLLILKTLDQSLFSKAGIEWFTGQHADFPLNVRPSPYFRLIEELRVGNEFKQAVALISCLLRKIHLHEEFLSFQSEIKSLSSDESPSLTIEQAEVRKKTFDDLLQSLSTIRDVLINATDLISQEKSSRVSPCQTILPVVFSKISNQENPWPLILRWMIDTEFLQSLTVLIHLCILNQRHDLFNVIQDILREFFNSFDALVFLAHQLTMTNGLSKALFFAETKFEGVNSDPVGPQLRCAFQTLNYIDELKLLSMNDNLQLDQTDLIQVLHCLLSLILFHHYVGKLSNKRRIIVRVLAMESNFQVLLKLIDATDDNEALKTSIRRRYVARILYEVFATSDSVLLLEKYGLAVLNLCEKHTNQRLVRLRQCLSPLLKLKGFDSSEENAEILIKELKTQLQETHQSGELAASLVTILRLIQHFSIPPENQFVVGAKIELKYDFMLLKLFGHGLYPLLLDVLDKCTDRLLCSWQIGVPLNIPDRIVTYGILIPALIVFRTLLQKLMCDRKTKFVDIAPVRTLLSIYTVTLCASPSTELTDVDIIRSNVIDSLVAYTWSLQSDSEPVNLETCAWTLVLQEILRLAARFPYSTTSGLCLLTELLPIPLPHNVRQALSTSECNAIKDDFHRYHSVLYHIWIHDSNNYLQKFIQTLCHASSSIMQEILRRLCMQLIDLGPKLAKLVMKTLMDELISSCKNNPTEATKNTKLITNDSGRLVAFIATLVSIRSGKSALLSILNSSDEKYSYMFKDLLDYLHTRPESNETCLCQEATMSIIQTLCDTNLSLTSLKSSTNPLQFLANTLPKQDLIFHILTNILRLLSSTKQQPTWTQTTMALRTMISLAEHDFGLRMIQSVLAENKDVFCTLIAEFDLRFDKEQPDYLEAVSALMIFLERIMMIESNTDSSFTRTQRCPLALFRDLLGATANSESPLEKFAELINAVVTEEPSGGNANGEKQQTNGSSNGLEQNEEDHQSVQALQKILARANSVMQILKSDETISESEGTSSITLPKAESLEVQFQNRLIYIVTNEYTDDQRNSELYWLGIPPPSLLEDVDYGQDEASTNPDEANDKVKCDLEDLIGKYCGTFNFVEEYKKEVIDRIRRKRNTSSSKKRTVNVEPAPNVDTSIITTSASKSRVPWSAPMRGNNRRNLRPGITGATTVHLQNPNSGAARRIDHFRNRPLNTSRPPSMHVDEYEKQFNNDNANGLNSGNASSSNNNNNLNENNTGGNSNSDNEMMNSLPSSSDSGPERERWPRRGVPSNFRPGVLSYQRYPFIPGHLSFPGGSFGMRDRFPYGYPPSRYAPYEMEFPRPYFGGDEPVDDRLYDFYPMTMSFDPIRYRGHGPRYDPSGYH